jgi:hypothetical protein
MRVLTILLLISFPIAGLAAASASEAGETVLFLPSLEAGTSASTRPLAIVRRFKPMVRIKESSKPNWVDAQMAFQLFDRDTLRTGADGYAVLQLVDNSLARVRPNSELVIRGEQNARGGLNSRIQVESGELSLKVEGRVSQYEVATSSSVASVKGTEFTTRILPNGDTEFTCLSGVVEVMALGTGQTVSLTRRRRAVVDMEGTNITVNTVSTREVRQTQNQSQQLDAAAKPKSIRLRFVNPDGQVREIEIRYFEEP